MWRLPPRWMTEAKGEGVRAQLALPVWAQGQGWLLQGLVSRHTALALPVRPSEASLNSVCFQP